MSGRESVLARVRAVARGERDHPGAHPPPPLPDGFERFASRLRSVGGEAHGPVPAWSLGEQAARIVGLRADGGRILATDAASRLLGPGPWVVPAPGLRPGVFEDVAVALLGAGLGVAENAAVAVSGAEAPDRALPFLCRHLVLLLPAPAIHPDLHSGFRALPPDALEHHHLTWISGPSKTADIEQTLVYGAHGPLTLDVLVYT